MISEGKPLNVAHENQYSVALNNKNVCFCFLSRILLARSFLLVLNIHRLNHQPCCIQMLFAIWILNLWIFIITNETLQSTARYKVHVRAKLRSILKRGFHLGTKVAISFAFCVAAANARWLVTITAVYNLTVLSEAWKLVKNSCLYKHTLTLHSHFLRLCLVISETVWSSKTKTYFFEHVTLEWQSTILYGEFIRKEMEPFAALCEQVAESLIS